MKISDVLAQDTVTLNDGDYLVANTESVGFFPTKGETQNLHLGKYHFKIVSKGDNAFDVVPLVLSEDGQSFVPDEKNPVVSQSGDKLVYITPKNDPHFRDGYHNTGAHEVKDIPAGEEARQILIAFLEFANSQYSMGVNDFRLEGEDYDTNVPSAPKNLKYTSTSDSVTVTWDAVPEADSYKVYRGAEKVFYKEVTEPSCLVEDIAANTNLSINVTAVNSFGESPMSYIMTKTEPAS
ncbi:putative fibronectin type III domain-containing protein [Bacillus phage vB_BspH_Mawwa]|nr:putative fibronectin type III domain-containing protein [Bacillus phage vB_BspH_Mawwa]